MAPCTTSSQCGYGCPICSGDDRCHGYVNKSPYLMLFAGPVTSAMPRAPPAASAAGAAPLAVATTVVSESCDLEICSDSSLVTKLVSPKRQRGHRVRTGRARDLAAPRPTRRKSARGSRPQECWVCVAILLWTGSCLRHLLILLATSKHDARVDRDKTARSPASPSLPTTRSGCAITAVPVGSR
jgi:hypothetical protein